MKSLRERINEVLGWRSDDFGHDTHALLVAESEALQEIGEKFLVHLDQHERTEAQNQRLRESSKLNALNKLRDEYYELGKQKYDLEEENAGLKRMIISSNRFVDPGSVDSIDSFKLVMEENEKLEARIKELESEFSKALSYANAMIESEWMGTEWLEENLKPLVEARKILEKK